VTQGLFIGLISGTSMDGMDAVVARPGSRQIEVLASHTFGFDDSLRAALSDLRRNPDVFPSMRLARLDAALGDALAAAALEIIEMAGCRPADITAIGSHGQTVLHHPCATPPFTLQIGDPWRLAQQTGITVVADFRRADLAAGGQGAPLAPLLHEHLFRLPAKARLVVNLGGIANLTVLAPETATVGFDTGPANCLLDEWYRRHHSDAAFDHGGEWASSGTVDENWLASLVKDPFFALSPPKSTGIEYFSPTWLDTHLPNRAASRPADIQATLAELSARTLADAIAGLDPAPAESTLLVCGGGVHNHDLTGRIRRLLPGLRVESTAAYGVDPDYIEATLFAWLAERRLRGERVDTRSITGAQQTVLAGTIFTR